MKKLSLHEVRFVLLMEYEVDCDVLHSGFGFGHHPF